jgi:signal transduction histidine kinase
MELAIAVHGPHGRLPLAPDTEEQLYLLVREAPANTVKRAHATAAAIDVAATDDAVAIEVGDGGRGFAPAHARAESFGRRSMHSRAAEFGGRLEITSAPSRGTVVRVAVPAATRGGKGRASPDA